MLCPDCNMPLQITTREGVEIDYCVRCRGVWLDQGELEKLIERSRDLYGKPNPAPYHVPNYDIPHKKHKSSKKHKVAKTVGHFLGAIFDFD